MSDTSNSYVSLNDVWTYYFHDPDNNDWSYKSYNMLCTLSCIQDFWVAHSVLKDKIHLGMFFLMREHVFPCWDDENNKYGGCLSIKVLKQDMPAFWEELSMRVLGENLLKRENLKLWDHVNGISCSPKKHFCIVKIWLKTEEINNESYLMLPPKNYGEVLYKSNKDSIDLNNKLKLEVPVLKTVEPGIA